MDSFKKITFAFFVCLAATPAAHGMFRCCRSKRAQQNVMAEHRALVIDVTEHGPVIRDADVNAATGWTPLHRAAFLGDLSLVASSLKRGSHIEARDKFGSTPLYYATRCHDTVRLLLAHGADINAQRDDGQTPLHVAVCNGYKRGIGELLASGADSQILDHDHRMALQCAAVAAAGGYFTERATDGVRALLEGGVEF